jgi:hypothetical protein
MFDEVLFPQSIVKTSENLDPENLSKVRTKTVSKRAFDLTHMDDSIHEEECWLPYYGIPEPEGTQHGWIMPWMFVIAACVAIVFFIKVMKEKQR